MPGIDNWLPFFDVGERHEVILPLTPQAALRRALATPVAPDHLVRLLLRLRGLRPQGSIEQFMVGNGFLVLERTPTTYVVGLFVGQGKVADPAAWKPIQPGSLKIAADFRTEPVPGGARLITETRVAANGLIRRLVFHIYWLAVGPFSALIRRRWLHAVSKGAA